MLEPPPVCLSRQRAVLVRIVRLTIRPEEVESFLEEFDTVAPKIRSFPGCSHLELWRDQDAPNVCTTCSHWSDEEALDAYRNSDLFRSTWGSVKPLFAADPEAHSYSVERAAATIDRASKKRDPGKP